MKQGSWDIYAITSKVIGLVLLWGGESVQREGCGVPREASPETALSFALAARAYSSA